MLWQTAARIFTPLWPSMSSQLRCYCGCGGVGRIRLGSPRMTLLSLKCKLKACIVHHEKLHTFMRLYEEAGDDLNRKAILLNVRRMAREHKVGKIWGPVSLNSAGSLCPAPSPLRAMPKGRLRFSSPVPTINSEALQRARDTIYGPEITHCFQQPSNGAYRNNVTSAQKLALRAQRRAFEEVAAQNAQQATYRRALEEALVDATAPKESAPAWLPHPRVPGAYFPGLSWERIKSSPADVVATLTGFPSHDFVCRLYEYLDCHGGLSDGAMYRGEALRAAPPQLPPIPAGSPANYWETHFIPKAGGQGSGKVVKRALEGVNDFFHFLYICRGHTHAEAAFHFGISEASSSNHFVHMAGLRHLAQRPQP